MTIDEYIESHIDAEPDYLYQLGVPLISTCFMGVWPQDIYKADS